ELTRLEVLKLSNTEATDAALAHIASLTQLRELELSYAAVTDAGLASLSRLTALRRLGLDRVSLSGEGLAHLSAVGGLRELELNGVTGFRPEATRHFEAFSELERLDLGEVPLPSEAVGSIRRLTRLRLLSLAENVPRAAVRRLHRDLPNLTIYWGDEALGPSEQIHPRPCETRTTESCGER
ncbi:MAG: hypothetical protein AAF411_30575, partial [Myxococcota bacterium]